MSGMKVANDEMVKSLEIGEFQTTKLKQAAFDLDDVHVYLVCENLWHAEVDQHQAYQPKLT